MRYLICIISYSSMPRIQKLLIANNTKDNAHDDKHKGCSTATYALMSNMEDNACDKLQMPYQVQECNCALCSKLGLMY